MGGRGDTGYQRCYLKEYKRILSLFLYCIVCTVDKIVSLMTAVSFPDKASSQLTLHTDAARKLTSVECQMSMCMGCKHELRWYLEKERVESGNVDEYLR